MGDQPPMEYFSLPLRLAANPHLYDYSHAIHFLESGAVKMFAGAGQQIISVSRGRFAFQAINHSEAIVSFFDLIETDPYENDQPLRDLADQQHRIVAESGVFVFRRPIHREDERPFDVYRTRYVFSADPLMYARSAAVQTAFYHLEMTPEGIDSERYYYPRGLAEPASEADVKAMGITTMPA